MGHVGTLGHLSPDGWEGTLALFGVLCSVFGCSMFVACVWAACWLFCSVFGLHASFVLDSVRHERLFVLKPLVEIAPDVMHPVLNQSVSDLYESLEGY